MQRVRFYCNSCGSLHTIGCVFCNLCGSDEVSKIVMSYEEEKETVLSRLEEPEWVLRTGKNEFRDIPLRVSVDSVTAFRDIPLRTTIESSNTFKDIPLRISS